MLHQLNEIIWDMASTLIAQSTAVALIHRLRLTFICLTRKPHPTYMYVRVSKFNGSSMRNGTLGILGGVNYATNWEDSFAYKVRLSQTIQSGASVNADCHIAIGLPSEASLCPTHQPHPTYIHILRLTHGTVQDARRWLRYGVLEVSRIREVVSQTGHLLPALQ